MLHTYSFTKNEIPQNNLSVLITFNIPKKKIRISLNYPMFIGFQNWIKILANKNTLLVSVCALPSLYLYYLLKFQQLSKSHYRDTVPLLIPEVVSVRCGFSKTLKNFQKMKSHVFFFKFTTSNPMISPHLIQQ
jgi:hypothetical protein